MNNQNSAKVAWLRSYSQSTHQERLLAEDIAQAKKRAINIKQYDLPDDIKKEIIQNAAQQCEEYQKQLVDQIKKSEKLRTDIRAAIGRLENQMQQAVLEARYIEGLEWWKISTKLHISERWARNVHQKAIESLESVPSTSAFYS